MIDSRKPLSVLSLHDTALDLQLSHSVMNVTRKQISDARSIQTVMESFAGLLDTDKAVEQSTVKTVRLAVEHFTQHLGYAKVIAPSLEDYGDLPLLSQQKAAKELRVFQRKLDRTVTVAQEGLIARFVNAVKRAFTSKDDVIKKTHLIVDKLKQGAEVNGKVFEDAPWARIFAVLKKPTVGAADVLGMLKRYHEIDRARMIPLIKEASGLFLEIARSLDGSKWVAKDRFVVRLRNLSDKVRQLSQAAQDGHDRALDHKAEMDVTPLNQSDAKRIAETILAMANDSSLAKAYQEFDDTCNLIFDSLMRASTDRLAGNMAADMRAFNRLCRDGLDDVWHELASFEMAEFHLLYGAYKYLSLSVHH